MLRVTILNIEKCIINRNPRSHEVPIRRPAKVTGHCFDETLQASLSEMDLRDLFTDGVIALQCHRRRGDGMNFIQDLILPQKARLRQKWKDFISSKRKKSYKLKY